MKLFVINKSTDSLSYLNGDIVIPSDTKVEIIRTKIKDLIFDDLFIKDIGLNNIFVSDGHQIFNSIEKTKDYLNNITKPITQIIGGDWLYYATVDSVGRLATNANITFPEAIYRIDNLRLNGAIAGSKSMNISGSPSSFKFQPNLHSLTNVHYIEQITIELEDQGDFLGTNFGALGTLTTGIQINVKSKGQIFKLCLLQDNSDIYNTFAEFPGSQSIAVLLQANRNMYFGTMTLQNRITLDPALGDYIEAVVNDNLTGLSTMTMRVSTWRTLG